MTKTKTTWPGRPGRRGSRGGRPVAFSVAVGLAALVSPGLAVAQTWEGDRENPSLAEVVAIDTTGEDGWPFGREDVAGDGLDTFQQQEQSIDIRTAYAVAGSQQLWVRLYVSDDGPPGGSVVAFVFIDADEDSDTGGSAAGAGLDPGFDTDDSPGGYEYVIGIDGNGSIVEVWEWDAAQNEYTSVAGAAAQATAEVGTAPDPLGLGGSVHGYLQGNIDLDIVGLDSSCSANLYFRSLHDTGNAGEGDLNVGEVGPCVAADSNGDRIPDLLVSEDECQSDADCPAGGVCVGGECVLAPPCRDDSDCDADETCEGGRCVLQGGDACETDANCGDLVCEGGECVPCTTAGVECGPGLVCAPNGRCIDDSTAPPSTSGDAGAGGIVLAEGEEIEGGAGNCATGHGRPGWLAWATGMLVLTLSWRRRRRVARSDR